MADFLNPSATVTKHDSSVTSVSLNQTAARHLRTVRHVEKGVETLVVVVLLLLLMMMMMVVVVVMVMVVVMMMMMVVVMMMMMPQTMYHQSQDYHQVMST